MAAPGESASKGTRLPGSATSFQKKSRSKLIQIPGAKASVHTGQLTVSSGVPSLDCALGGGLAVGSLLLIEEDEYGSYSRTLLQYFLAEGVMCGHELFIASAQDHPDDIIKGLPSPLQDEDPEVKSPSSSYPEQQDAMKIAWRYQNLPKVQTVLSSSSRFGHYYDLSKHMEQDLLQNAKIHTFYLPEEETAPSHHSGVLGSYAELLHSIQLLIKRNGFDGSKSQVKTCNVLRLALPSLGAVLWGDTVCVSPAHSHALLSFLYALRALLRTSLSVAVVTVPTHMTRNKSIRGRIIRLSDTAVALRSFSDAERNNNPLYKDYHGLLNVIQVPRLNCLGCEVPDTKDLAFRLKRKQFTIEGREPRFPTVFSAVNFDPEKDATWIDTAIKTKGVDEDLIIDILTKRTYSQRREIAFEYEKKARRDMISALKGALSGSLENVILGLMKNMVQFDAFELRASMKGLGTDEESLIEMVCSRSNEELLEIKKVYKELFKKDLEKDVSGDTSGDFCRLLLSLVEAKREEPSNIVDYEKIDNDARALYEAGVKRKGTDVATWISIFSERSVPHLQKVFQRYNSYSPYDIKESIRKEVKGDLEKSFLTLVECFENKQLYFASKLNEAMKNKTLKEKVVTRIVVSRCEVDLMKIRMEFKKHFGKSLYQTISEHTKGDYQRALLNLCGGDD